MSREYHADLNTQDVLPELQVRGVLLLDTRLLVVLKKNGKKQTQRRAVTKTAAFIRVVGYNDESSFNLDSDFEMNPASTKHDPTWDPSGQIYGAHMSNPYRAHTVFVHLYGVWGRMG